MRTTSGQGGKGDDLRPGDKKKYDANYPEIFGHDDCTVVNKAALSPESKIVSCTGCFHEINKQTQFPCCACVGFDQYAEKVITLLDTK